MKPTVIALLQLVFAHSASALLSTNITRIQSKDKFTNPNRTAVKVCLASGMSSSFPDSCVKFDSVNTQAECWNSRDCCESCQCKVGYPTYLAHLGKCVSLSEINSDVFGHGSIGRSLILLHTIIFLNSRMSQVCLPSTFSVSKKFQIKIQRREILFSYVNFIFLRKVLENEYNHVSVPMEIVQMNGHTIGSRLQSVNKLSMG